jgi:acetolactate synthase-1/2/3 large subunit
MILSAGANRKRVSKALTRFVEKTGIYAVSTQTGKGVLSDEHTQSLFCLGIHKQDYAHSAIDNADLVITVGYSIVEYPPALWNEHKDKRILHIDFVPAEPDEYYNPTQELIGDISYSLLAIHERLGEWALDTAGFADLRQRIHSKLYEEYCGRCFPPLPQQIVKEVREVMGARNIISLDNGIYKIWFARMYKTYAENTVLLDNALATMGAGLAAAMTAKLLCPSRKVLAILGDGGFMMNSQDLETAVRLKMNLVILLLRDDAYGFIRWKQQAEDLPDYGVAIGNPDFVAYANAYGATGLRVTENDRLSDMLRQAFETGGVVLIDCLIDYSANELLSRDLRLEVEYLVSRRDNHEHGSEEDGRSERG